MGYLSHLLSNPGALTIPAALYLGFLAWMVVDCLRSRNPYYWIFLMFLFQPIGVFIYFALYKVPEWEVGRRMDTLLRGSQRVREIKARLHHMDLPHDWVQLADEHRTQRNWEEAARCYESALEREPDNESAHYGLGLTQLERGRHEEALKHLVPLAGGNLRYAYGRGTLAIARANRALGRRDEALAMYQKVLEHYTYSEANYEYADLLAESGERRRAAEIMRRIVEESRITTDFSRRDERRWGRRARRWLRLHPGD